MSKAMTVANLFKKTIFLGYNNSGSSFSLLTRKYSILKSFLKCKPYSIQGISVCRINCDFLKSTIITSQHRAMGALSPLDPSSYSRPEISIIKHAKLTWNIDFGKKILSGWVDLNIDILQKTNELILDIGNQTIKSVKLEDGSPLEYKIDGFVPSFGSKLTITLPKVNPDQSTLTVSCVTLKSKSKSHENESLHNTSKLTVDSATNSSSMDSTPCSCEESITGESTNNVSNVDSTPCSCEDSITAESANNVLSVDSTPCSCEDGKERPTCHCCSCESNNLEKTIKYDGVRIKIRINYETDPSASALQWLEPSQTSGKKHPYMFSQCQPIHARTIMPCQDTPAVKFTYEAEVTAPSEFTVLMSALRQQCTDNTTTFRQPVPIPSYLLAIAVGALESRRLGPRSLIWTEKEEIERSAWEFAETEKYLQAAEKLCGPYVWTQYDLLLLPPSFPYGGMENPCLTFVTPTLLAGDRSQADVIVHEIMHSWTGNLITNRNFEHFWLNEGFTVFLERKVGAALINDKEESKRSRDFHSLLGLLELKEAINTFGDSNPLTNLILNLSSIHPDDSFSRVPYEKGSLFLRYLEDLSGGPDVFDEFLRSYLNNFKMKSIDTNQFKDYLLDYFKNDANASKNLNNVNWDIWLHTSGMPPIIPEYDTSMNKAVTSLVNRIMESDKLSSSDVSGFSPHQKISLLQELIEKPPLPIDKLKTLGKEYNIDNSKNYEIVYRWLRLCIKSKDIEKLKEIFDFINQQGRMKYVRPIYRDLYAWEEVRQQAIDNFLKNEKNMMHVTAYTVRKDLHLSQTEK